MLSEIRSAQDTVEDLGNQLKRSMTELHELQDRFEKAVKKQEKALNSAAKAIRSNRAARPEYHTASSSQAQPSSASASTAAGNASNSHQNDLTATAQEVTAQSPQEDVISANAHGDAGQRDMAQVDNLKKRLGELQQLMPASGGMFVEIFLGSLNVRFMRKSERLAFKTEYEKLKMKLSPCLLALCIVCLIFEENRWLHMILQLALSCYYVTLAVRENILRVNGSNIKAWWIIHHYFTMMQAVLLLTWPNGRTYIRYRRSLHLFGLYNAILQIFQTRYQMARLYALRSLGMAGEMDVASSDSTQIHWSEGMLLLLPLILLGQLMQAVQSFYLMRIYRTSPHELQILMLSLLFCANFVGNFYTTLVVLLEKRTQSKNRRNAAASKPSSTPHRASWHVPVSTDKKTS